MRLIRSSRRNGCRRPSFRLKRREQTEGRKNSDPTQLRKLGEDTLHGIVKYRANCNAKACDVLEPGDQGSHAYSAERLHQALIRLDR